MIFFREFRETDATLLQSYLNDPGVTQFLSTRIPQPYTEADAIWWINEGSHFGIIRAIEHRGIIVGAIGAIRGQFERSRSSEIGYWIGRPYWGNGIASLALRLLTRLIFDSTDIVRLQAYVFEGNVASMKVLEKTDIYWKECSKRPCSRMAGIITSICMPRLNERQHRAIWTRSVLMA